MHHGREGLYSPLVHNIRYYLTFLFIDDNEYFLYGTEFREDTYAQRLFLFQEAILQRFGFIPCQMENNENDHQYVHITGNVFILVPSTISTRPRPRAGTNIVRRSAGQKRYPVHPDQPSPHEAYITRHVSGKNKDDYNMDRRVGQPHLTECAHREFI